MPVSEDKASTLRTPGLMDGTPDIRTYASTEQHTVNCPRSQPLPGTTQEKQDSQKRSSKRSVIKARSNRGKQPGSCSSRSGLSFMQASTAIESINDGDKALISRELTITALENKVLHNEELNSKLTSQLAESTYALIETEKTIAHLKSELVKKNAEIKKMELQLVDHGRAKQSEALLSAEVAKRHICIIRLKKILCQRDEEIEYMHNDAIAKISGLQDQLRTKYTEVKKKDVLINQLYKDMAELNIRLLEGSS